MKKCYTFIADGHEEGEYINVVDILKRAGIETKTISITNSLDVKFSHGIVIKADNLLENSSYEDADILFFPGGMPGAANLSNNSKIIKLIDKQLENNKRIAAICAAPAVILGHHGFLKNKKATCYPGFEQYLKDAIYCPEKVITDGLISTARGLGAIIDLGLEIIKLLFDEKKSIDIAKQIQYLI